MLPPAGVRTERDVGQAAADALGGGPSARVGFLRAPATGKGQRYESISAATIATQDRDVRHSLGHIPAPQRESAFLLRGRSCSAAQGRVGRVANTLTDGAPSDVRCFPLGAVTPECEELGLGVHAELLENRAEVVSDRALAQ